MKKLLASAFAGVMLLSGTAVAKEATTTLKVSGWHCGGCGNRTAKVIKAIDGVKDAATDVENKTVTITYDDEKTNAEAFEKAITGLNYKIEK